MVLDRSTALTGQHRNVFSALNNTHIVDGISELYPGAYYTMLPLIVAHYKANPDHKFMYTLHDYSTPNPSWQHIMDEVYFYDSDIPNTLESEQTQGIVIVKINGIRAASAQHWPNEHRVATAMLTVHSNQHVRLLQIRNILYIVTTRLPSEFFNRIITIVPAFFPEYKSNPEIMEIIRLLSADKIPEFSAASKDYFNKYTTDLLKNIVKDKWIKVLQQSFVGKIAALKEKLTRDNITLEHMYEEVRQHLVLIERTVLKLEAYKTADNTIPSDVLDYILNLKGVVGTEFIGTSTVMLTFSVPCKNYDVDLVSTMLSSAREGSYWRNNKKYLHPIFIEERYTLYLGAMLDVNFAEYTVNRSQRYRECAYEIGIPSHHFYRFDCLGMNKAPLMAALQEKDYIYFFTNLMNVAGGLNFNESAQVAEMFDCAANEITNWHKPCIKNNTTGEFYTWKKYMEVIDNEINEDDQRKQTVLTETTDTTT